VLQGHTGFIHVVKTLQDGTIISGGDDKRLRMWKENGVVVVPPVNGGINSIGIAGDLIVTGGMEEEIRVRDSSGVCVKVITGHRGWINCLITCE
jgi:WD40 repeat protein